LSDGTEKTAPVHGQSLIVHKKLSSFAGYAYFPLIANKYWIKLPIQGWGHINIHNITPIVAIEKLTISQYLKHFPTSTPYTLW